MWDKKFWCRELWRMFVGTTLMALAVNIVYDPMGMIPGGFSGASILLARLSEKVISGGLPVWMFNLLLNIPLFVWGLFIRGREFIVKSMITNLIFSSMLYLIPVQPAAQKDYFLAAIMGGILTGSGIGLVFSAGYSTGGTDLLSSLIQKYLPHYPVAKLLFVLDAIIILAGAAYFGVDKAIYAAVSVYLTTKIMDGILAGLNVSKQVMIISAQYNQISSDILSQMERGVTELSAKGGYSRNDRPALLCIVGRRQVGKLLHIVKKRDPSAFIIISDVREVLGEGFGQIQS
ncbi:MAG: YitT family protein [Lachnospiraceae bacterium]|nr:YitT family protein [Lachnospiraceae bacterium]